MFKKSRNATEAIRTPERGRSIEESKVVWARRIKKLRGISKILVLGPGSLIGGVAVATFEGITIGTSFIGLLMLIAGADLIKSGYQDLTQGTNRTVKKSSGPVRESFLKRMRRRKTPEKKKDLRDWKN